ncbi:MAG: A/G-specific adenine glycosylase [Anaerolineales bacterium]|nr:MAG: A/G-specific adenine glycosylase [Anaerolineales bacterium]
MTGGTDPSRLTQRLLDWYQHHQRDLPWRRTKDPYRVTVSEFMLHQTRVQTVLPYYRRFLGVFPDWPSLAAAPLDRVLKAWEGLGYYARARNLHALAQRVCSEHGGHLPESEEALLALPGVGPYTAGAILSICFGRDRPAIDGNTRRVLCRVFQITQDPTRPEGRRRLQAIAASLLPPGQADIFNQAWMDLGAVICTPRRPACGECPLSDACRARKLQIQESLPVRRPRKPLPHHDIAAGVIWRGAQILIARRPPTGLLGGLWEFPGGKREPAESLEECLVREVREELGIDIEVDQVLSTVRHAYTHFRITLHAFHCRYISGEPQAIGCTAWKWVTPQQLDQYAFPAANRAIIESLQGPKPP